MKEKKDINIHIGREIRIARLRAGLTQAQFGEMMSLDTKNVSDIERGVTGIKISTLKRICERLPISSDVILFGENDRSFTENVDALAERLKRLSPDRYQIIEDLINKTLETFSLLSDD